MKLASYISIVNKYLEILDECRLSSVIISRMNESADRLVNPEPRVDDSLDQALRPSNLSNLIGQERIKENLAILIAAARKREEPLDHVMFYGPPGLGKQSSGRVI